MAFKGTRRRDAFAIAAEIEAVGGHLNAYTSREHTAYYARTLAEDLPLAVDLLGDILLESTFAEDELAREKDVIVQEIGQSHDTPDDIVFDYFQEAAYPGQPIGRPVLGSAERVSALGAGALRDWLKSRYTAPRMVLSAAGAVEHDRLCDLASEAFAGLPAGAAPQNPAARYGGGERREDRELEQLHLVLGCEGVSYDDEAFPALQVLSALLGGGMSSRLFQEAREKRGLAYAIYSFASSYVDGGLFGVYAGCAPADAAALLDVVFREIAGVRDGASADEIARARRSCAPESSCRWRVRLALRTRRAADTHPRCPAQRRRDGGAYRRGRRSSAARLRRADSRRFAPDPGGARPRRRCARLRRRGRRAGVRAPCRRRDRQPPLRRRKTRRRCWTRAGSPVRCRCSRRGRRCAAWPPAGCSRCSRPTPARRRTSRRFCEVTGHRLEASGEEDGARCFLIRARGVTAMGAPAGGTP